MIALAAYWREGLIVALGIMFSAEYMHANQLNKELIHQQDITAQQVAIVKNQKDFIDGQNEAILATKAAAKATQDKLAAELAKYKTDNKDLSDQIEQFTADQTILLKTCTEDQAKDYGSSWQLLKQYREGKLQ